MAYVSGNFTRLLGLPRPRWSDISLVCDPFGGGCDPDLLKKLHSAGARISCKAGLHAKAFLGSTSAIIGSANISAPALDRGNIEAACLVSDPRTLQEASSWFSALAAKATPFASLVADPLAWGQIEAAWLARMRGERPQSPHLRDALLHFNGSRLLSGCVCSLWSFVQTDHRSASAAAKSGGFELPDDWSYDLVPAVSSASARRLNRVYVGKSLLSLRIRDDGKAFRFVELDPNVWRIEATVLHAKGLYVFSQQAQSPVRLGGKEAKLLLKELNQGLRRHPKVLKHSDIGEFVSPSTLAGLLR